jgi:hypothetical protein
MRKLWIGATLALMTTSAHAEVFNFGVNGGTARIESLAIAAISPA